MQQRARHGATAVVALALLSLVPGVVRGEAQRDRFSSGGYLRIATRPDLQGGNSRLGFWNLYGRLLNEGNWGALEMKLDLLQPQSTGDRPWTSLRVKIEGGSVQTADAANGSLLAYRASQLYVQAGNLLLKDVTWQLGTLDSYYGDLGLYDMRPAQLLFETVGLSARYQTKTLDALVGFGDSGYFMRGPQYSTILTAAASLRVRFGGHFELGGGGQYLFEPQVVGNRFAPYNTAGAKYEDYARGEVVKNSGLIAARLDDFPDPVPVESASWKAIGYVGFGGFGPLLWNNTFFNVLRRHPEQFSTERYENREFTIYVHDLTDERYQFNLGNEMRLTVVPGRVDVAWGFLYGRHWDVDNTVKPTDDARTFASTVLRVQTYLTETLHLLAETSFAHEESTNGNTYRNTAQSIFANTDGTPDERGLERGDARVRQTWQGKFGPVLNPLGTGIYTRPSLRLLYGVQHSSQNLAYGNSFVDSRDQNNIFTTEESHWHHVLGVEAEAWF